MNRPERAGGLSQRRSGAGFTEAPPAPTRLDYLARVIFDDMNRGAIKRFPYLPQRDWDNTAQSVREECMRRARFIDEALKGGGF